MQYITATFITDSWRANGLSPIINISTSGAVIETGVMTGLDLFGNYSYEFTTYDKTKLYFFNIDADDADVNNRYKVDNNELDFYENKDDWKSPWIYNASGWNVNLNDEKKKMKKLIEEIVKKTLEWLPQQELTAEKVREIVGSIVAKIPKSDIEIDYWTIIGAVESNTLRISKDIKKDINKIKIPDNKELIQINKENKTLISKLTKQLDKQWENIQWLYDYINKTIKRGNLEDSADFKKLIKSISDKKKFKDAMLDTDENFILLRNKWV